MKFEWDENKNRSNKLKHGIRFEEAKLIFDRTVFALEDIRKDYGKIRYISMGMAMEFVVVVAHTTRDSRIRIISARLANRRERKKYYDYLKRAIG